MTHVQLLTNLARVEDQRQAPVLTQAARRRARRPRLTVTRLTRNAFPMRTGRTVQA
jgi:hypothetical protein